MIHKFILKDRYIRDVLFSLITFFLLVISANVILFPDMPGFLGLNPHPYLIVILLISGRFGLKEGLITAFLASLVLSIYVYIENDPYFSWGLFIEKTFLLSVISYFLAAIIVGEMRGFNKSYERSILRENSELKTEQKKLKEQLEIVTQIKEELENQIIGQEETIHSLYQETKALETMDEKQFYQALTKLTARFTGATRVSLYMIDYSNEKLSLTAQYGSNHQHGSQKKIPLDKGILGKIYKNNSILTIREISENPDYLKEWDKSSNKAYAYVPISMASVTVGILTIDDIPFLKLNISTVRILSMIAELAVSALKNIISYQDLQEMVEIDPVTELIKYDSFVNLAESEYRKTQRYKLDLSVIFVEVEGFQEIKENYGHDTKVESVKWIGKRLQEILRTVDISGLGPEQNQFSLALPVTDTEGVLAVIDRLKQIERRMNQNPKWHGLFRFHYGAVSYHPSFKSFQDMLKSAQNSLKLNKLSKSHYQFSK